MNRKNFPKLILLVVGMYAGSGWAQSSITFSGAVDEAVKYVSNRSSGQGCSFSLESSQFGSSIWGLGGSEDIGNGWKTVFNLTGSFNAVSGALGTNGDIFDYTAIVGASNSDFGDFKVGRAFALDNGVYDFDPFLQQAWSSASLVEGRNWNMANNSINYWSPRFAGFDLYVQLGLGNQVGWNRGVSGQYGRTDGAQVTYTNSVFQARAIYDEMRDSNGKYSDVSVYSKESIVGVNLFAGNFTFRAAYTRMWADAAQALAPSKVDHSWFGVTYRGLPALSLSSGVYHVIANGEGKLGGGRATLLEAGATYDLSKRTMLYLTMGWVLNSEHAQFALSPNGVGSASNPDAGESQRGAYVGIRHSF